MKYSIMVIAIAPPWTTNIRGLRFAFYFFFWSYFFISPITLNWIAYVPTTTITITKIIIYISSYLHDIFPLYFRSFTLKTKHSTLSVQPVSGHVLVAKKPCRLPVSALVLLGALSGKKTKKKPDLRTPSFI